jgi:hypothetical protein
VNPAGAGADRLVGDCGTAIRTDADVRYGRAAAQQGCWRITAVAAPHHQAWEGGFLGDDLEPNPAVTPTSMRLSLAERAGGGSTMTRTVGFVSDESMQEYLELDFEDQLRLTVAQAEALLRT